MNRREFLGWVGVGGLASFLPVAIAACSPDPTTPSGSTAKPVGADGFQEIGTVAELDQKGQILNKQSSGGTVLVVRDPAKASTITAAIAVFIRMQYNDHHVNGRIWSIPIRVLLVGVKLAMYQSLLGIEIIPSAPTLVVL